MKKILIIISILFYSCDAEFNLNSPTSCERVEIWYKHKLDSVYATCPDKCDLERKIKPILKEYIEKKETCK